MGIVDDAVSYTHLDVYKRQTHRRVFPSRARLCGFLTCVFALRANGALAVSYTHLEGAPEPLVPFPELLREQPDVVRAVLERANAALRG